MASRASPDKHQPDAEKTKWPEVKTENTNSEIKEFAETGLLNELLGWYGYDKMAREDGASTNVGASAKRVGRGLSSTHKHSTATELQTCDPDESPDEDENKANNTKGLRISNDLTPGKESPLKLTNQTDKVNPKMSDTSCGWCNKQLVPTTNINDNSASGSFCSELCFSQSRRASFKKNKTCDWCRHVRHTVSYVDFQDGASQLQFCSDKCLNQYKMHIFCREAQAHLELLPHIRANNDNNTQHGLITPELWLRNCQSPSTTDPVSPVYTTPPPPPVETMPVITVAHPSKLMEDRKVKTKKIRRSSFSKETPQDLSMPQQRKPFSFQESHFLPPPPPPNMFLGARPLFHPDRLFEPPLFLRPPQYPFHNPSPPRLPPQAAPSLVPPVTILVPYPIILPIPLPIPIPIPLDEFMKAANASMAKEQGSEKSEDVEEPKVDAGSQSSSSSSSVTLNRSRSSSPVEIVETISSSSVSIRPLRKRKKLIGAGKEEGINSKEINNICNKTRKINYLSA